MMEESDFWQGMLVTSICLLDVRELWYAFNPATGTMREPSARNGWRFFMY